MPVAGPFAPRGLFELAQDGVDSLAHLCISIFLTHSFSSASCSSKRVTKPLLLLQIVVAFFRTSLATRGDFLVEDLPEALEVRHRQIAGFHTMLLKSRLHHQHDKQEAMYGV